MVTVAQLAERWIVVPNVVGSSPISHPKKKEFRNELLFLCRYIAFESVLPNKWDDLIAHSLFVLLVAIKFLF